MILSVVRLLAGATLALAICGGALAAPARAATTWNVIVGGESADHALQAQAFLPTQITINQDDTITWTTGADFVHTVTFLSGGTAPPVVAPEGNLVIQPTATAFPSGGPSYDGTGFVNSGLLEGKGKTYSLTFTKAGTYDYLCLLHPGMVGQVAVQAAGSAYPMTQAQIDAQASAELYDKLSRANQDLQNSKLTSKPNPNGATSYTVVNGAGGNQASVLRFLPVDLTVKAGDSVTWLGNDPHEVHTVTFYNPAGKVPDFIVPQPQASGPPKLVVPHAAPENDTAVDSQDLYNSGLLLPGQSYTFTFPKPGTYTYVCVVHAPQAMFGKVVVEPAGAGGAPASLPNTGAGSATPILPLLGGALLLLLGILLRGVWRRQAVTNI
jgi:LPXTG-motif cell wall-anchored protein